MIERLRSSLLGQPQPWTVRVLLWGYVLLLALVPFHAFLTTWLASIVGHYEVLKSWPQLLLLALFVPAILVLKANVGRAYTLLGRRINQLILAYLALHLLLALRGHATAEALLIGLAQNLRFLAMFVLAQILVMRLPAARLRSLAWRIVLAALIAVLVFGTLQITVLPPDWLRHFGYRIGTIEPFDTIDQNPNFIRIMSTLRGSNPLGIYLAALLPMFGLHLKRWKTQWAALCLLGISVLVLYGSFSRSAWLGFTAGALVIVVARALEDRRIKELLISLAGLALAAFVFVTALGGTSFFQNVVLHDDRSVIVESSDQSRLGATKRAVSEIVEDPIGAGPGTAGPASFHDDRTRIAENYYLQLGQEVGILGLLIFLAIIALVAQSLWQQRSDPLALGLLAGLVAVSFANLFLHAWTDETVSLTWWGLAGLWYKQRSKP